MDVIEKAIRNAFEKGDASDQTFRERVYRQAFAALDRVLQANPGVTVESAIKRRKALQAKIVDIEQEFIRPLEKTIGDPLLVDVPPLHAEPPDATAASSNTPRAPVVEATSVSQQPEPLGGTATVPVEAVPHPPEPLVESDVTPPSTRSESTVPVVSVDDKGSGEAVPPTIEAIIPTDERRVPSGSQPSEALTAERVASGGGRRRRPMAAMFVAVTLFSLLAIGIWWAMQTGLLGTTTQSEPVTTIPSGSEDYEPGADEPPVAPGQADANRNWIPIFNGNNSDAISAPSDASAEMMNDDGKDFMRIRSGDSGAAVMIDVGPGILEQIAGKRATFDIVAKAEEGNDTQMSITCNFGELGDCGRKRYAVGNAPADFLFEIDIPAKKPGAAGTIAINSDFDNEGKSVDIYEIRVTVDQ